MDLPVDFGEMRLYICPSVREIFRTQGGVGVQQLFLSGAQTASLLEHPHKDAGANNARLTSADSGIRLDTKGGRTLTHCKPHSFARTWRKVNRAGFTAVAPGESTAMIFALIGS